MLLESRRFTAILGCVVALGALFAAPAGARRAAVTPPSADEILSAARKTAAAEHKNVFVHFSASWCGWCHKLEAFLTTPAGKLLTNHAVDVILIVQETGDKTSLNNPGATELMKRWGGTGGIPFYVFLDAEGTVLADANGLPNHANIGYPANAQEYEAFDQVLIKGLPKLSAADRATIIEEMRKHP